MNKIDEVRADIEKKKAELARLEAMAKDGDRDEAIKHLHEFSVTEKVEFFNNTYLEALNTLLAMEKGVYHEDNDNATYMWETVFDLLAKDKRKFDKYINSLD